MNHLGGLRREHVRFWRDPDLKPGDSWNRAIAWHIKRADMALLLISADALKPGGFIETYELPDIRRRIARDRIVFVPVMAREYSLRSHADIAQFEVIPNKGQALGRDASPGEIDRWCASVVDELTRLVLGLPRLEIHPRTLLTSIDRISLIIEQIEVSDGFFDVDDGARFELQGLLSGLTAALRAPKADFWFELDATTASWYRNAHKIEENSDLTALAASLSRMLAELLTQVEQEGYDWPPEQKRALQRELILTRETRSAVTEVIEGIDKVEEEASYLGQPGSPHLKSMQADVSDRAAVTRALLVGDQADPVGATLVADSAQLTVETIGHELRDFASSPEGRRDLDNGQSLFDAARLLTQRVVSLRRGAAPSGRDDSEDLEPDELSVHAERIGELLVSIPPHVEPKGDVLCGVLEREGYKRRASASQCIAIAHVNVLPSTVPQFRRLIQLGFPPHAIIIVPKPYSTIRSATRALRELGCEVIKDTTGEFAPGRYDDAARRMLGRACRRALLRFETGEYTRCVLLDDSGLLSSEWDRHNNGRYNSISVQHTASGFSRARIKPNIRRVDVGRAAAVRFFDAKVLAGSISRKLKQLHLLRDARVVGVVGMGFVGRQIAHELRSRGKTVYTYDRNSKLKVEDCHATSHWSECVQRSDFIFGCTGVDFMKSGLRWLHGAGAKHLVSVSSEDVEFQELLRNGTQIDRAERFGLIKVLHRGAGPFLVINGGFPINFDREREWDTDGEVSLRRNIELLGVLQSLHHDADVPNTAIEKLSLLSQYVLVRSWLHWRLKNCNNYNVSPEQFEDRRWWYANSGGAEYKGDIMRVFPIGRIGKRP